MQNEQTLKMPQESDPATQLKLLNSSEKRSNASNSRLKYLGRELSNYDGCKCRATLPETFSGS